MPRGGAALSFQYVVFDFDGTVARTEEGILNSVRFSLEALGLPDPGEAVLRRFIGPPLYSSFEELIGLSPADAERAVRKYRERYAVTGLFEAQLYPGVEQLLRELRAAGIWTAVASGKPELFLKRIVERFGLTEVLDAVAGPSPDNHSADKSSEILRALPADFVPERACMVGDRCFDIDSGRMLGMFTVGVTYGYGSRGELEAAGADAICGSAKELGRLLLKKDRT